MFLSTLTLVNHLHLPTMEKQKIVQSNVVIIGAGLSGIDMACQLQRQLNVSDFMIYDRASEMGGAWAANKCNVSKSCYRE